VGSANFNSRSLSLDEEANLVVFDPSVTRSLAADYDRDLERSEVIEAGRWERRGPARRALQKATQLVAGHL
jgi:cardiolipin synthase A/B